MYTKAQEDVRNFRNTCHHLFNKVWIVADKAKVLERNNTAYVVGAHLKVMLEERLPWHWINTVALDLTLLRLILSVKFIIPELEKESQSRSKLRQFTPNVLLHDLEKPHGISWP